MTRPAVDTLLLDRDGTLIWESAGRVTDPARVRVRHDVARALSGASQRLLCITNQSVIGRGQATLNDVERVHETLARRYDACGVPISGFLLCPHAPWDNCPCRKPLPGLLHRAAEEHHVDLARALVVGDRLTDAQAAEAAGCAGALLLRNHRLTRDLSAAPLPPRSRVIEAADLGAAVRAWPSSLDGG